MSEYGLIKDTTIQGIADSLRDKGIVPRYAEGWVDCEKYKSNNATSLDDPTPIAGAYDYCTFTVSIPEAVSLEFVFHINYHEGDAGAGVTAGSIYLQKDSFQPYSFAVRESTTTTTKLDPYYGNTVTFGQSGSSYAGYYYGVTFEVYGLDADGNRIQLWRKSTDPNRLTPSEMIEAINNAIAPPPEEAFKITGDCANKFAYSGWNWFLNAYSDKIIMTDITNAMNMFQSNPIESLPMEIHLADNCNTSNMFNSCANLEELPIIHNFALGSDMFGSCYKLKSLNNNAINKVGSTVTVDELFRNCRSLRSVGNFFEAFPDVCQGNSIFGLYQTFYGCYSIDEILNLPYVYSTYGTNYFLGSCVDECMRLKNLTFRNQVVTKDVKSSTLSLTPFVGYANVPGTLLDYGFTTDKQVVDDATYHALKNDPDWWTANKAYSRYNHDSAVTTINSLPDTSGIGVTNIIKFDGACGAKTDGGAINTLTAEEIAVAAAKGWTVTLV